MLSMPPPPSASALGTRGDPLITDGLKYSLAKVLGGRGYKYVSSVFIFNSCSTQLHTLSETGGSLEQIMISILLHLLLFRSFFSGLHSFFTPSVLSS